MCVWFVYQKTERVLLRCSFLDQLLRSYSLSNFFRKWPVLLDVLQKFENQMYPSGIEFRETEKCAFQFRNLYHCVRVSRRLIEKFLIYICVVQTSKRKTIPKNNVIYQAIFLHKMSTAQFKHWFSNSWC